MFFHAILIIFFVCIDQITKCFSIAYLKQVQSLHIIKNFLNLTYVENTGAAFGIFRNQKYFFIVITLIILITVIYYYKKHIVNSNYKFTKIGIILIISGAIGNFIDRLFRGYVVDFIDFRIIDYPVFNIADIYICTGTFIIILLVLLKKEIGESK